MKDEFAHMNRFPITALMAGETGIQSPSDSDRSGVCKCALMVAGEVIVMKCVCEKESWVIVCIEWSSGKVLDSNVASSWFNSGSLLGFFVRPKR